MANIAPASSRTVRTLVRSGAPHLSSSPSPSSEAPPPPPRLNRKAAKAVRLVNSKKKYLEVRRGQFVKMANPDAFTTAPPLEIVRRLKTVIEKSERDERVNISTTLTDVKTYMGGFTRPRDLRSSNWWPGGMYRTKKKRYESPPEAAYQPHTVFLLESRYKVRGGRDTSDAYHHVVGVCRAGDLPGVIARYNSSRAPGKSMEAMDNALWPWAKVSSKGKLAWCEQDPDEALQEDIGDLSGLESQFPDTATARLAAYKRYRLRRTSQENSKGDIDSDLASSSQTIQEPHKDPHRPVEIISTMQSGEPLHTASPLMQNSVDGLPVQPRKQKNDNFTDSLESSAISEPNVPINPTASHASSLTQGISELVLPTGTDASTCQRSSEIPAEVANESGDVISGSGFVVPSSGAQLKNEDSLSFVSDDVVLDGEDQTRGRVTSNNGTAIGRESGGSSQRRAFSSSGALSAAHSELPEDDDLFSILEEDLVDTHLSTGSTLTGTKEPSLKPAHDAQAEQLQELRERYLPTLAETPFYRPLVTLTFPTRPIAVSIGRLAKARARGLAFYAAIDAGDRKSDHSFTSRMRCMRIDRMIQLTTDIAANLAGFRGGIPGLRFSSRDRGYGIQGERMAAPIPPSKRRVVVCVGDWYSRAEDVKECFRVIGEQNIGRVGIGMGLGDDELPFDVYGMDESGLRQSLDGTPLPWPNIIQDPTLEMLMEMSEDDPIEGSMAREISQAADEKQSLHNINGSGKKTHDQKHSPTNAEKERRAQVTFNHRRALALALVQNDRRVMRA